MERTIRRLLLGWLLLLGGVLLTYHYGYTQLAYWLLWPVVLGTPIAAGLQLLLLWFRGCELWHRMRTLWRARHWRQKEQTEEWWIEK